METYQRLLLGNKAWAQEQVEMQEDYFERHHEGQQPEILWIGCADSRVDAAEITGSTTGEIFVHRNIANLVIHTDFNMLSVLQYAVEFLHVKHIIVCGHYECGGIKNAVTHQDLGLLNKWLRHIKDIYRIHRFDLEQIPSPELRHKRLVELNVFEQAYHLVETSIVQKAWKNSQRPIVHGWVYDLANGHILDLIKFEPGTNIEDIYRYEI